MPQKHLPFIAVVVAASSCHIALADLTISDIDGTATDGLYVYSEGVTEDILAVPTTAPVFWSITTPTSNTLLFETQIDVGRATARITLTGLEANDDWLTASIAGTNGIPTLTYDGGDSASVDFADQGQWFVGDTVTITFVPVPEPSSVSVLASGLAILTGRRRRTPTGS